ncbi:MAG: methylated-DNA--[protein]-cysteine S-methyltransferase, partial [Candidatus Omnitrophica bacterium]|nr:methylated-DNA--[protein]-cysteine S-methyltransferase [Candidatus Omnitrophota bacterium]
LDLKGPPKSCRAGPPKSRRAGTPFQIKVWNCLRKIPYGKMYSYKFIACKIATCSHSRAVGNAVAKNPVAIFIPCHRVINSNGDLGNYGPGKNFKKMLLKIEKAI